MSRKQTLLFSFVSGEIHLTPLKGVLQLRPSFEYLDHKQEKKPNNQDEGLYSKLS